MTRWIPLTPEIERTIIGPVIVHGFRDFEQLMQMPADLAKYDKQHNCWFAYAGPEGFTRQCFPTHYIPYPIV